MSHRKLLVASLLLSAAIVWVVLSRAPGAGVYSYEVATFLARGPRARQVRVSGYLVHGSLCRLAGECAIQFALQGRDAQMPVRYEGCNLPGTVREAPGIDVSLVVEGERCAGCPYFVATQVMARCPGKYEYRMKADPPPCGGGGQAPPPPPPRCTARM